MASHVPSWESGDEGDKAVKGAIAYIEKCGKQDAKRLREGLQAVQPSTIKLRSLAAKGQVFNFKGYAKLQNAVASLTGQSDRIGAFGALTGSTAQKWEHQDVLRNLKAIMTIDPDEIRKSVAENNVAVLEFTSETYKRIYGSSR
jgi:hypothetical protein